MNQRKVPRPLTEADHLSWRGLTWDLEGQIITNWMFPNQRNLFSHSLEARGLKRQGAEWPLLSWGSRGGPFPASCSLGGRAPGAPVSASTWPHVASSPVCPCLTESHELWYIVFLFSFISSDFLISFALSSWIHWLVKHVLLNFHTWNFPDFLLLLMSGLPALWSEKVFCIIPTFFIFINISVA